MYGVDKFMWDAMYFELDGTCPICMEREVSCVDHDHDTGKVRGLLCLGCNTMLGFMESGAKFERAKAYMSQAALSDDPGSWWSN